MNQGAEPRSNHYKDHAKDEQSWVFDMWNVSYWGATLNILDLQEFSFKSHVLGLDWC